MKIASSAALSPSCIFSPTSPQKVSQAVKTFTDNQCKFAILGEVHSAVPNAAYANDCIPIVTEGLNELILTNENSDYLGPYHKSVVAGRYYPIGTGLLLRTGLSFGNEYGRAIDNVKTYEVVLDTGTIIHANATSNPDLHLALKRGGDNFGVITRYELITLDTQDWIWGGIVYYNQSQPSQVDGVLYNYHVDIAVNDVKAHVLLRFGFKGTTNETIKFSPIFTTALKIAPPLLSNPGSTLTRTKHNAPDPGRRPRTGYKNIPGFYGLHFNMPVTPNAVQQGVRKGGNMLGMGVFPAFATFVKSMLSLAKKRSVRHPYIMWSYIGHDEKIKACGEGNNIFLPRIKEDYDPI
ncbi:hypothetical protein B9Z19DRAFT_1143055 [Tuber borchii]|uniref:FAD-binding PCMH-type domain-containing protein n=1 Tax=Tuber borchii TaxID=42251 RepID=A0A2T6ZS46_TUBBO|nr:hypothetical protein B9Z19DRAFT_1143055 [Tuber borchii]